MTEHCVCGMPWEPDMDQFGCWSCGGTEKSTKQAENDCRPERRAAACMNACAGFETEELEEQFDGVSMDLKFVITSQAETIADLRREIDIIKQADNGQS